jgi:hypothetical protein
VLGTAYPLDSANDLVARLADEIAVCLDLRACWFEPFPFDALLPRIEQDRVVLPAAEPTVRPYADWQPRHGIELPVRFGALTLGRFVLVPKRPTCGVAIDPTARAEAIAIADSAAGELANQWFEPASQMTERGTFE